jgi:hypothetical protein
MEGAAGVTAIDWSVGEAAVELPPQPARVNTTQIKDDNKTNERFLTLMAHSRHTSDFESFIVLYATDGEHDFEPALGNESSSKAWEKPSPILGTTLKIVDGLCEPALGTRQPPLSPALICTALSSNAPFVAHLQIWEAKTKVEKKSRRRPSRSQSQSPRNVARASLQLRPNKGISIHPLQPAALDMRKDSLCLRGPFRWTKPWLAMSLLARKTRLVVASGFRGWRITALWLRGRCDLAAGVHRNPPSEWVSWHLHLQHLGRQGRSAQSLSCSGSLVERVHGMSFVAD